MTKNDFKPTQNETSKLKCIVSSDFTITFVVWGEVIFYYQLGWALVLLKLRYYGYLHRLLSKHCTGYPWMSIPMNWTQLKCCIIHSHHWNISLLAWQTYHYNTNKHTAKCRIVVKCNRSYISRLIDGHMVPGWDSDFVIAGISGCLILSWQMIKLCINSLV